MKVSKTLVSPSSVIFIASVCINLSSFVFGGCRDQERVDCETVCHWNASTNQHDCNLRAVLILPSNLSYEASLTKVLPVFELAEQKIREDEILPRNVHLNWTTYDDNCESSLATISAVNGFTTDCAHVQFGPICDYSLAPVSRIVKYFRHDGTPLITVGGYTFDFIQNKTTCANEYHMLIRAGLLSFQSIADFMVAIMNKYEWKHALLYYERDGQYNVAGEHTCHLLMQTIAKLFRSLNLSFSSFPTDQAGNNNVTETLRKKVGLHESRNFDEVKEILTKRETTFTKGGTMEIQALLSLMTVVSPAVKIIGDLNDCFNYDHNIYLAESSADIDHLVRNGTIPRSLFILNGSDGSVRISDLRKIGSKDNFIIVVPAEAKLQRNLNLLNKVKDFHRLGATVNVGILFQNAASIDDVRNHFLWFKHQSIANIFAVAYPHTSIFTFHSFGNFEVINVTNGNTCKEIYPSLDSNFHRHKFRVLPLVSELNKQFWTTVFQLMNATYTIHRMKDGVHIVTTLHVFHAKTRPQPMYPISISHENIIVPEAEPFSGFYAYLLTLTSNEFFAYSAGTVAAIVLTLSACRYIKQKKFHLWRSFIDVLNLLIINDNGYIAYSRLSWAETFVIVPLTFVGFIVVNGYLSSLQSYFTKPALQPKMKTLADIYNSKLQIATFPSYFNSVLERVTYGTDEDWSNRIVAIDDRTLVKQMCTFNISTSYTMGNNDFDMLSGVQRRLKIRGFYDTGITVTRSLSMYPVHESFLFFDKLNDIVHRTHSTGLYQRWLKNAFTTIERDVLAHNRKRINLQVDDDEFDFPIFIAYGWSASVIVLIIEIMWSKIKQRIQSKFP